MDPMLLLWKGMSGFKHEQMQLSGTDVHSELACQEMRGCFIEYRYNYGRNPVRLDTRTQGTRLHPLKS